MLELGFTRCQTEHVVFHRYKDKDILIVAVDVDDLTMAGTMRQTIAAFKQQLSQKFKIKDLGDLRWLLGIEVKRDHATRMISFSQQAYIDKILEKFNLHDAKPLSSLLDPHHAITQSQSPATPRQYDEMRGVPYREAIGSLMYAALGTRPTLSRSVFCHSSCRTPGGRIGKLSKEFLDT